MINLKSPKFTIVCHKIKKNKIWRVFWKYLIFIRTHGDICHEQIECSSSGDPHLQCQKSKDDAENFSICLCSEKFNFDSVEKKCKVVLDHFTVKKMYPKPNDGMVLIGGSAGFSGRLGVQ